MSWKSRAVHQQLEGELQPGVHLPSSRFSLAFFSSSLHFSRVRRIHFEVSLKISKFKEIFRAKLSHLRRKKRRRAKIVSIKNVLKMCQTTNFVNRPCLRLFVFTEYFV